MKKAILALLPALLFFGVGCKKKTEDPAPETVIPVTTQRTVYAYFKGQIDGKNADYVVYLDRNTQYTSYLSNSSQINSTGGSSKFVYGNAIQTRDFNYGVTLSFGTLSTPAGQGYPTKSQFLDFFTLGKYALVGEGQNGAKMSILETVGSDVHFYQNTVQAVADTAYVEFTKITKGTELGTPTVYYEATVNATVVNSSTGAVRKIRNASMKGSFQPDYLAD
jgi:hypothetical protein